MHAALRTPDVLDWHGPRPQGIPAGHQPYYMAPPPGSVPQYPVAPYVPVEASSAGSSIPWWIWMGLGVLVANVLRLVSCWGRGRGGGGECGRGLAWRCVRTTMHARRAIWGPCGCLVTAHRPRYRCKTS